MRTGSHTRRCRRIPAGTPGFYRPAGFCFVRHKPFVREKSGAVAAFMVRAAHPVSPVRPETATMHFIDIALTALHVLSIALTAARLVLEHSA